MSQPAEVSVPAILPETWVEELWFRVLAHNTNIGGKYCLKKATILALSAVKEVDASFNWYKPDT